MAIFDPFLKLLRTKASGEPAQQTGAQTGHSGVAVGATSIIPGYDEPQPGSFDTWQQVARHPTFAMALAAMIAPIEVAGLTVDADDGTPEDAKLFIEKVFTDLRPSLVRDCNHACIDGYAPFEKVFVVKPVLGVDRLTYHKLKWLWADSAMTKILIDPKTGGFAGIRQRRGGKPIDLSPEKSFVWTVNRKGDNYYGDSFADRAAKWVSYSDQEFIRSGQYSTKVSGVVPVIKYPPGKTTNPTTNQEVDNHKIAQQILDNLSMGNGVAVPNLVNTMIAKDPRAAAAMSSESLWSLEFMQAGPDHSQGHGNRLSQLDKMIVRSVYQPERRVIEATLAGSRADSGTADDLGLLMSQLMYIRMVGEWNKYLVDPLLRYNFGESLVGGIRLKAGQIIDESKAYLRSLATLLTGNATLRPDFIDAIDIDQLLEGTGIPRRDFIVAGAMDDPSLERAERIVSEDPQNDPTEQAA